MKEAILPSNFIFNPFALPHIIASLLLILLGIFVYIQNRKSLAHISYFFVCLTATVWLFGDAIVMSAKSGPNTIFWAKFVYLGITFIPPSMYFFSSSWLNLFKQRKKWVILSYLAGLLFIILFFTTDKFVIGYRHHYFGNFSRLGKWGILYLLYFFLVSFAFFIDLIKSYLKETDETKKLHKKRILTAFIIAFIGSTEFLPTYGISLYPIGFLMVFLFNIIVAHTIIRYRLMNIETVFHKTIAWIFSNFALLIPFLLLGYSIKSWYASLNFPGAVSSLAALSLSYLFVIKHFQPKVDHFFQRRQYNLEDRAIRFTEELVHLKGLNQLIELLEETIADTLYPQHIDIFIYNGNTQLFKLTNSKYSLKAYSQLQKDIRFVLWLTKTDKISYRDFIDIDPQYEEIRRVANDYFRVTNAVLSIPLVLNEKLLGVINLGKKANLQHYRALDLHFLNTLKSQATIALSNSLLYKNIEEQVKQRTKELVDMQRQLIQAEKLASVGTLAGGVAHEINNPLTAILTNIQMLLTSNDGKFDRESLELIEEATKRCRTIVQKLMAYAKRPLETSLVSKVDLLTVLKNVIGFIGYQLEQDNIKIIINAKENDCFVMGSHNELEQVVTNIILNARDAIKQIKKAGEIQISLLKGGDWAKIVIKDEGIGIPKELLPKIFDPFFTTKEVGKGTGLGLSICQSIVEKHNGIITVQSEPNKGSTFTVQLPQAEMKSKVKHA